MHTRQQAIGRYGALLSWANTPDRTARTANARKNGPGSIEWHLARLDPVRFADASEQQRLDAADAMRRAYYARLALKSARARQRGGGGNEAA